MNPGGLRPNDALRFRVGRHYRVRTKDGQECAGRCTYTSTEKIVLVAASAHHLVWTGGIRYIANLDALETSRSER